MKTRSSFVANSSSSSFLILGNKENLSLEDYPELKNEYEIVDRHADETGLDVISRDEEYSTFFVGATIFDDSSGSMSIEELVKRIEQAKKKLAEHDVVDYKVFFGERYS